MGRNHVYRARRAREAFRNDWNLLGRMPTEAQLLREIRYYTRLATQMHLSQDSTDRWRESLYRAHASHRKKLLAALRDGRPEAWFEYPD